MDNVVAFPQECTRTTFSKMMEEDLCDYQMIRTEFYAQLKSEAIKYHELKRMSLWDRIFNWK